MSIRVESQSVLQIDPNAGQSPPLTAQSSGTPATENPQPAPTVAGSAIDAFIDPGEGLRDGVTGLFRVTFGTLASRATKFHGLMETVFGSTYDQDAAERIRVQSVEQDFSWLPSFEFLDSRTLRNANGAYDAQDELVLLNDGLRRNIGLAAETYVEEVGHHLDVRLKSEDTRGDEGELFRRLLLGEDLSVSQVNEIRRQDDSGEITIRGLARRVEFWASRAVYTRARRYGDRIRYVVKWVFDPAKDATERGRKRKRIFDRLIKAMQLSAAQARSTGSSRGQAASDDAKRPA